MANQATHTFRAGLVQMRTGRDVETNLRDAGVLVREAAGQGAQYVQTPEITTLMETERTRLFSSVHPEENNRAVGYFGELALGLGIWLHVGSMPVLLPSGKIANRSLLFSPGGAVAARVLPFIVTQDMQGVDEADQLVRFKAKFPAPRMLVLEMVRDREGFIHEHPARLERLDQARKQRAVEIKEYQDHVILLGPQIRNMDRVGFQIDGFG